MGLGHRQIGFISTEPYWFTGKKKVNRLGSIALAVKEYKLVCEQNGLPVICEQIQITKESIEQGVLDFTGRNPPSLRSSPFRKRLFSAH